MTTSCQSSINNNTNNKNMNTQFPTNKSFNTTDSRLKYNLFHYYWYYLIICVLGKLLTVANTHTPHSSCADPPKVQIITSQSEKEKKMSP